MTDILLACIIPLLGALVFIGFKMLRLNRAAIFALQVLEGTLRDYQIVMDAFDQRLRRLEKETNYR